MRIEPGPAHLLAFRVIQNHRDDRRPAGEEGRDDQRRAQQAGDRAERVQRVDHVRQRDQAFAGKGDGGFGGGVQRSYVLRRR